MNFNTKNDIQNNSLKDTNDWLKSFNFRSKEVTDIILNNTFKLINYKKFKGSYEGKIIH